MPAPIDVDREGPPPRGRPGIGSGQAADGGEPGEDTAGGQTTEICDHAVVGEDLELTVGDEHGREPVVLSLAVRTRLAGTAANLGRPARARGSMVAVGDVRDGHRAERVD